MDWRFGTDVPEGDYGLVSVNDISLNSALNNATEKTITHQSSLSARLGLSILVIPMRVLHKYLFSFYLEGHTLERSTYARPPDTLPRRRFEGRTMVGTHEITAVESKKLVVHPIQRDTNVGAPIHVRVQRSLVIEEYAFDAIFPVAQGELLGHTGRKLVDFANEFFFGFFLGSFQTHALLLNQPGVRYFLPDSSLRLRPDLCKLAADKGTLPRTGQIYTGRFHARRAPHVCST
jgi:hypothetical protein